MMSRTSPAAPADTISWPMLAIGWNQRRCLQVVGEEGPERGDARQTQSRRSSVEGEDDARGQNDHDRGTLEHPVVDLDRVVLEDRKSDGEQEPPPEGRESTVEGGSSKQHGEAGQHIAGGEHESSSSETCH